MAVTNSVRYHQSQQRATVSPSPTQHAAAVVVVTEQVRVYWHFREELNSWCGEQRGGHVTDEKKNALGFIRKFKGCVRE